MLLYLILAVPVTGVGAAAAVTPWRRWIGWISWLAAAANGAVLVIGSALAVWVTRHHPVTAPGGVLRADALSAFMVVVIGAIALLASCQSARYLSDQTARGACSPRHAALYTALVQAFTACMLIAVLAANLGVMWVAVEATTITTTFLVGHRRTDGALEASWKYMVICSAGIALAFLGTALVYYAGLHAAGHPAGLAGLDVADGRRPPPQPSPSCGWPWRCWSSATAPRPAWPRCTAGCRTPTARRPPPSPRSCPGCC